MGWSTGRPTRISVRSRRRDLLYQAEKFNRTRIRAETETMKLLLYSLFLRKDVLDTPARKKRSSSHREEGEMTETFVAQMTVFDKNRCGFVGFFGFF